MAVKIMVEGIDIRGLRRDMAAIRKATCRAMAMYWLKNYLRLHFRKDAVERYGYRERVKMQPGGKRKGRDDRPLISSGKLVSMVTRGAKVRVYRDKGLVVMPAPDYVRFRGMTGELTTVTQEEAVEIAGVGAKAYRDEMVKRMKRAKWAG